MSPQAPLRPSTDDGGSQSCVLYPVFGFHPSGVANGGRFLRKNNLGRGHTSVPSSVASPGKLDLQLSVLD